MDHVQTVNGPVSLSELGCILPHEHVTFYFDKHDMANRGIAEDFFVPLYQRLVQKYDCNAILEATPRRVTDGYCKRKVPAHTQRTDYEVLQTISRRSGMHIIASTGYYVEASRPESFQAMTVAQLADGMIADITQGMDDTGIRAGIIKIAVDSIESASDRKLMEAAAIASKQTGAAITTHTCSPEIRLDTLNFLEKAGALPSRIYLGHADANSSLDEAMMLAGRGCNLLYTIWGITNPRLIGWRGSKVPRYFSSYLLRALIDEGYAGQVLASVDFNTNIYDGVLHQDVYEIPERTSAYAFTFIKPSLKRLGLDETVWNQIMRENPRRMLTIES